MSYFIDDRADNSSNRFSIAAKLNGRCDGYPPGPFWGVPSSREKDDWLLPTAPSYPNQTSSGVALERYRETERRLSGTQPVWKLCYPGSVGSQTLLGIPAVAKLRDDPALRHVSLVWPFETGFHLDRVLPEELLVLHAEIWPGVVNAMLDLSVPIRDQAQVQAMVNWLAALDASDKLLPLFERPAGLSVESVAACVNEEGWILGAGMEFPISLV